MRTTSPPPSSVCPPVGRSREPRGDLSRWRLIQDFQVRLAQASQTVPLHPTWSAPGRRLKYTDYLSLFLFGLLNPVARTLNGLCAASQ